MRVEFLDVLQLAFAHETMLDGHHDLGDDFQFAVHEHIERVGNDTFGGVLHGDDAEVRLPRFHRAEHLRNGGRRTEICEGAKVPLRGLLREGPLRAQVGHPLGGF